MGFCVFAAFAMLVMVPIASASLEPIDPSTWSYNTGYTYTLYSYATYCSENGIWNWTCLWCQHNSTVSGFVSTKILVADGELVYLGYNPDYQQIVVAWRGSSDIVNWLNDFDVAQVPYPYCQGCQIHKGFYDTWNALKVEVMNEVWRLHKAHPGYVTVTTGHSLGAALATISSVDIFQNVSGKVYTWTLGSPRVGNKAFATWYHSSSGVLHNQRMVNWKDIVPHIPTEIENYYHVPQEAWEQKDVVDFKVCNANDGEDPKCSDSVLFPDAADHTLYFGLDASTPC